MIRRIVLATVAVALIVACAAAFMLVRREQEWTSSSPEAIQELRAGLMAEQKLYKAEAIRHYERALQLDPDFAVAKLLLLDSLLKEKGADAVRKELLAIDTKRLTDRERFFVEAGLARIEKNDARFRAIVSKYVENHPDDPWGLARQCGEAWMNRQFAEAQTCYERLLKTAPNWVSAQNNLGYLAMAQGRFADAENAFRMYRYIAPDQANPHDSLGELLTLVGRYDEAAKELEEAIRIRSDFSASWDHLVSLELLRANYAAIEPIIARGVAARVFSPADAASYRMRAKIWQLADESRAAELLVIPAEQRPQGSSGDWNVIRHAAALAVGDFNEARRVEEAERRRSVEGKRDGFVPGTAFLEAKRLAAEGNSAAAIELLKRTDAAMDYWGMGDGVLKLAIRTTLAQFLRRSGDETAAEAMENSVREVNPHFLDRFRSGLLGKG